MLWLCSLLCSLAHMNSSSWKVAGKPEAIAPRGACIRSPVSSFSSIVTIPVALGSSTPAVFSFHHLPSSFPVHGVYWLANLGYALLSTLHPCRSEGLHCSLRFEMGGNTSKLSSVPHPSGELEDCANVEVLTCH